jgi:hypothetical protein
MAERDWRRSLRGAVYRGDGMAVVALARTGGMRDDALQLMGEGLLAAIIGRVEHAAELGADCVNALRARGWYGDDDLAEQLDAALGRGAIPMRRSLPIDLDELATILEGDQVNGGGRIDLRTGEVWHRPGTRLARRRRLLPSTAQPPWTRAGKHSPGGRHERDPHPRTIGTRRSRSKTEAHGLDGSPQRVPSQIGHRCHANVALRQGNSRNRPPSSGRTTLK